LAPSTLERISVIVGNPGPLARGRIATRSDLAFVDAAIELVRASQAPRDESSGIVALADPASEELVYVSAYVAEVAQAIFKIVGGSLVGEDLPSVRLWGRGSHRPQLSLERLIEARAVLAAAFEKSSGIG